jgi:hypothetical protein
MTTLLDSVREYVVYGISVVQRRWLLIVVPFVLAVLLSFIAIQTAPTKYTAKALILLQGANRSVMGVGVGENSGRENVLEQVRAVDAWVKSEEVLSEILPLMQEKNAEPLSPAELSFAMIALRASLSFELLGNSALEVRLDGSKAEGLGSKLELILSRMMEGLTGPQKSILSAQQFMLLKAGEQVTARDADLGSALVAAGLQNGPEIKARLKQLSEARRSPRTEGTGDEQEPVIGSGPVSAETADRLVALYDKYEAAELSFAAFEAQAGSARRNYVAIFNSPENLLIIGRPRDPIIGESAARKYAMLSIFGGGALIVLAELMNGVLKSRGDFERVSGLPVVARMGKCADGGSAPV